MDRQHGGQAKGAKARTNREQVRVKSESLDGGDYDFDCDDEDSPENAVQRSACSYCRRRPPSRMKAQVVVTLCSDRLIAKVSLGWGALAWGLDPRCPGQRAVFVLWI